jgi:hypothetical protein
MPIYFWLLAVPRRCGFMYVFSLLSMEYTLDLSPVRLFQLAFRKKDVITSRFRTVEVANDSLEAETGWTGIIQRLALFL